MARAGVSLARQSFRGYAVCHGCRTENINFVCLSLVGTQNIYETPIYTVVLLKNAKRGSIYKSYKCTQTLDVVR